MKNKNRLNSLKQKLQEALLILTVSSLFLFGLYQGIYSILGIVGNASAQARERTVSFIMGDVGDYTWAISVPRVEAEEELPMRDYVRQEIEKAGLKWSEAECIIENEGHWKNECNANTNLSTDCGIWRINSVHKNTISFADRLDYKKATAWAINKRLTVGHWNDWVAYRNHCK